MYIHIILFMLAICTINDQWVKRYIYSMGFLGIFFRRCVDLVMSMNETMQWIAGIFGWVRYARSDLGLGDAPAAHRENGRPPSRLYSAFAEQSPGAVPVLPRTHRCLPAVRTWTLLSCLLPTSFVRYTALPRLAYQRARAPPSSAIGLMETGGISIFQLFSSKE